MIEVHNLYAYNTWSQSGMSIVGRNYVMIYASKVSVENIISSYKPKSVEEFLRVLRNMDIKYETMEPISLEI